MFAQKFVKSVADSPLWCLSLVMPWANTPCVYGCEIVV